VFVDEFQFGFVASVHVLLSLLGYFHVRRADQFALRLALELPLHLFAAGRYEQPVLRDRQGQIAVRGANAPDTNNGLSEERRGGASVAIVTTNQRMSFSDWPIFS
jgi:hypothetical protein